MPTLHLQDPAQAAGDKPKAWLDYQGEIYREGKITEIDFNLDHLEAAAKKVLHPGAFGFVAGSAGLGATYKSNREEFDKYAIVPRMLVPRRDDFTPLETKLFGVTYPSPLILAPIGLQSIYHAEAEEATAKAAGELKVPFTLSMTASRSIEAVAKANGGSSRWFQLYWTKSDDVTISLLNRARDNGYSVLVVTLDVPYLGWRPDNLQTAYLPFVYGVGNQIGFSDSVFMKKNNQEANQDVPDFPYIPEVWRAANLRQDARGKEVERLMGLSMAWLKEVGSKRNWNELAFLKEHWKGPIVLKGILAVEDALQALEAGMDGIVVSNHGGRQVDGAISSLGALQRICASEKIQEAQSSGKFTVLFDSGIRSGGDIVKAMSLGAQGVMLGRPFIYGLALDGEKGVKQVVRTILADLDLAVENASLTKLWRSDQVTKVK